MTMSDAAGVVGLRICTKLRLPTMPVGPAASTTTRILCTPALSVAWLCTVDHDCQPLVFGIVIGLVLSTPLNSTCTRPPGPAATTLKPRPAFPAVGTLVLYVSDPPAASRPTLSP